MSLPPKTQKEQKAMGKILAMNMRMKIQCYPRNSMQIIKMDKFLKQETQPIYKYMERYSNSLIKMPIKIRYNLITS